MDYIRHKEDINKFPKAEFACPHSLATMKYNHN